MTAGGAWLSWDGMRQTWKQSGGGNLLVFLGIPKPVRDKTRIAGERVTATARRLRGVSPATPVLITDGDNGSLSDEVKALLQEPPMPSGPTSAQTAWLEGHVQRIREAVRELDSRTSQVDQALAGVVAEQKAELDQRILDVAVSGLPRQATGLLLVTIGTFIAAVPSLCALLHAATPDDAVSHALAQLHVWRR